MVSLQFAEEESDRTRTVSVCTEGSNVWVKADANENPKLCGEVESSAAEMRECSLATVEVFGVGITIKFNRKLAVEL